MQDPRSEFELARLRASVGVLPAPSIGWEWATILVLVKAYPALTQKTGEAVCIAGVRIDGPSPEWVRLFPVNFRALDFNRQFMKYQVIALMVRKKSGSDRRPETFFPNLDTLRLGASVPSEDKSWARRWAILKEVAGQTTTCDLYQGSKQLGQNSASLGMIKPTVTDLIVEENPRFDPSKSPQVNEDLFGNALEVVQSNPFNVHYIYTCQNVACNGHKQQIIDWESGRLALRNLASKSVEESKRLHRVRFFDTIASPQNDLYFFVGNQHQHPSSFLVLGAFYPQGIKRPADSLFDV